jgi:cell division septation protein DedD
VPATERILAFDPENGLLAIADTGGVPAWVDLRVGGVRRAGARRFQSLASADGWSIYGVDAGALMRLTPSGDWPFPDLGKVRRAIPTVDGTVLVIRDADASTSVVLRMRPPDEAVADSLVIPVAEQAASTVVGDRVYLGAADRLLSVAPNDMQSPGRFTADDDILALTPTPSGDRVFVANKGSARLQRFDRYDEAVRGSTRLPGLATELRMDPLGRWLLARPAEGDSVWVVSLATEELVSTLATEWRSDLPAAAIDGTVATLRGADVVLVDPEVRSERPIAGGASDLWFFVRWNGFRPRARGIDQPVAFRTGGPDTLTRTPVVRGGEATPAAPLPASQDTAARTPEEAPPERAAAPPPHATGWTVSFAAVLSMERAREIANSIAVDGVRPRVTQGETGGTTVFRVVMGPYSSRDDAERAGRASRHSFWVYEGVP